MKIRRERDARQFLGQVIGKLLPVCRRVQNSVDVVENLVLGDGVVLVVHTESSQGHVRDVVDAFQFWLDSGEQGLCARRGLVAVSREALAERIQSEDLALYRQPGWKKA